MRRRVPIVAITVLAIVLGLTACEVDFAPVSVIEVYEYSGGSGTSLSRGAIELIINPDGFYNPSHFYELTLNGGFPQVVGPGPGRRFVYGSLIPGRYRVNIWVLCNDYWDPFCYETRYSALVDVFAGTTTRLDVRP